jgi:hypothetical protein
LSSSPCPDLPRPSRVYCQPQDVFIQLFSRIPLREKDEDVRLDLQALLELAYRKGRYHLTIDYAELPDPPLAGDDAKWARTLVKAARPRRRS